MTLFPFTLGFVAGVIFTLAAIIALAYWRAANDDDDYYGDRWR